jgi:hypothetical protein
MQTVTPHRALIVPVSLSAITDDMQHTVTHHAFTRTECFDAGHHSTYLKETKKQKNSIKPRKMGL